MGNKDEAYVYDFMNGIMDVVGDSELFVKKNGQIRSIHSFDDEEYLVVVLSTRLGMTLSKAKEVYEKQDN